MPNLVGIGLSQVPTNSMLGGLAYQSPDHASIENLDLKYISQINAETADTAVDVFVYDTSRDTDGGAWRKRTQHTSWYNETLNTTTRGSRREFPAVAVIVLEATKLTIYDGDDPDLPMWMEFVNTSGNLIGGSAMTAVTALNGIIVTGSGGYTMETRFISDYSLDWFTNQLYEYKGNIEQRNDTLGFRLIESYGIVNSTTNDVAMTVLPNAPIDSATGLPIPTIAVATDGGVSVIRDDGTVINSGDTGAISKIHITEENRLYYTFTSFNQTREVSIPSYWTRSGFLGTHQLLINSSPALPTNSGNAIKVSTGSYGTSDGFVLHSPDPVTSPDSDYNDGMVAYATTSYNTGWMHGDIKGAFLSDTDTTNVSGSELVTNGTFDSNVSGWTTGTSTITYNSGAANIARNSASSAANEIYQDISGLTIGQKYLVSIKITALSNLVSVYFDPDGSDPLVEPITANATGTHTAIYTATQTSGKFSINATGNTTATATVDDVSMRVAELDRSVNNKGLQVFGTITKSAVATGADLVAYSDWSSSNYLRQPYNSDLNAGTGNFYIMCWVKGNELMLWQRGNDGNATDLRCEFPTSGGNQNKPRFYMYDATGPSYISFFATQAFDTTTWHHCVWVKDSPTTGKLYIDGVLDSSGTATNGPVDITSTSANFTIGNRADNIGEPFNGSVFLFRFGRSAPSAEQIKKIYEDEKVLFQENTKATLYGSSDAVTALAYDEKTELLHVGTSSGRSDFNGLRRINNTTTAVTTAISAYDGSIAQQ